MTGAPITAAPGDSYLDSCVLLSLFLGDSGYADSERWLLAHGEEALWISHWVLLEVAGVMASCVRRGQLTAQRAHTLAGELEAFRQERLALLEPRGSDFLQARQWLQTQHEIPLRSGDALHLALARRHRLTLVSADQTLGRCAKALGLPIQLIG